MKTKKLWAFLVPVVAGGGLYGLVGQGSDDGTSYRFAAVERGTVEQVVASTGTMQATETVEVGTQVSGLLSEIYVDFNDRVDEGQLLARIDPTILQQEVRSAGASLARNQAEFDQASRTLARATELFQQKVAAASDLESAQYQYDVASASLEQAQIALDRARRNLEYTEIRAPIDGVVIERAVETGQTVAASMSAPVLFVLAGDLSEMEILASVDESDIGLITTGQETQFTVQAYPEESFRGEVSQVRLQSSVTENVVTYDVVIDVENVDGRLLPGMTATVEFIVARAEDALKVSNSALRFSPTESMVAELAEFREERAGRSQNRPPETAPGEVAPDQAYAGTEPLEPANAPRRGQGPGGEAQSRLFFLDEDGNLATLPVQTGITDGQSTVIEGPGVSAGMQVIAAVTSSSSASAVASNPFQSQNGNRPPGPRGGM
ncbi:MAG: efflux RND transporter periplasmic adaptor subunit [Gemmatimonadota bacterium]|jgi:HlyD family secretion protein